MGASFDRSQFTVASLRDKDDSAAYWLTKTPQERLAALELLRQNTYGYDPATARLQRVLEVIELKER